MKIVSVLFFVCFLFFIGAFSYTDTLKKNTIVQLKNNIQHISLYSKRGYDTKEFEKMQKSLVQEAESLSIVLFSFRVEYITKKYKNILHLTEAGYAIEVIKYKELVQSRLTYLRDRIKTNTILTQSKKQSYFDGFEVIATTVFEKNCDLNGLKEAFHNLDVQDGSITKEVESIKKESLLSELQNYRTTCGELVSFFAEKNSPSNQAKAQECVDSADTLMGPGYTKSGADFVATLSRERVFTSLQLALQAKQKLLQDEQYALLMKVKEEERLTMVPPAPIQEGKVIVVHLGLQRLYAYENGVSLYPNAVPITTGKYGFETVTGEFAIYLKKEHHKMQSPFPGIYYDDVVNYWMPFYLGYGLHDAPWRSVYGTQDYATVGSHGCVNIPLKDTIVLYNWAEVGTRVVVI